MEQTDGQTEKQTEKRTDRNHAAFLNDPLPVEQEHNADSYFRYASTSLKPAFCFTCSFLNLCQSFALAAHENLQPTCIY